jgi:hypothetical protein
MASTIGWDFGNVSQVSHLNYLTSPQILHNNFALFLKQIMGQQKLWSSPRTKNLTTPKVLSGGQAKWKTSSQPFLG